MAFPWGEFGMVALAARSKVPAVSFKLYWWYCSTMRRGSHVSTWSQKKIAVVLGVSRATVNRWDKSLVGAGAIELVGGKRWKGVRVLSPGAESLKGISAHVAHVLQVDVTDAESGCSTSATRGVTDADTYQSSNHRIEPENAGAREAGDQSSSSEIDDLLFSPPEQKPEPKPYKPPKRAPGWTPPGVTGDRRNWPR